MGGNETHDRIGGELRRFYERMPKGGIPERIWVLLLLLEHDERARATDPQG